MQKLVVLSLGEGNLGSGFLVTAKLSKPGEHPIQLRGALPAFRELLELERNWQLLYSALYRRVDFAPRLEVEDTDVTNVSEVEFHDLCQTLSDYINTWLNSDGFRKIDKSLRTHLNIHDEIRIIIETNDVIVKRLPWHLWELLEDYPKAEIAIASPEYQKKSVTQPLKRKLKILAILGNSQGIDINKDKEFLEKLSPQATIKFLIEPSIETLNNLLWKNCDILFFAGHSSSRDRGEIQLNQTDVLTVDKLKYALNKAISGGLKLAIFNSCDGLKLAQDLANLHIPQVIVMRAPIADTAAQEFLKYFLEAFSSGQSLYVAVRHARERLQGIEGEYPCASWLPVICQNPAEEPLLWKLPPSKLTWGNLSKILVTSTLITILVLGARYFGYLQPFELQAYDRFMSQRPAIERSDERLLLVTIDESDIRYQNRRLLKGRGSLSDQALAELLQKLEAYKPQVIGIDVYRDFSVEPNYPDLANRLRSDDRIFTICKVDAKFDGDEGIQAASEVPIERSSFSDFIEDDDEVPRRHLLQLQPDVKSPCASEYAFSLQVASYYLQSKGIYPNLTSDGYLKIGDVVFRSLKEHSSGYQKIDASGYQLLLNYRSLYPTEKIATSVSLRDILEGQIQPDSLKNRLIIIGVTAGSTADYWKIPISKKRVPGIFVQAHMVSHILSAVENRRPLLWWWSGWVEAIWIWGWSIIGAVIVTYIQKPLHLGIGVATTLLLLLSICFSIFIQAGWIPFIPCALAFVLTATFTIMWMRKFAASKCS